MLDELNKLEELECEEEFEEVWRKIAPRIPFPVMSYSKWGITFNSFAMECFPKDCKDIEIKKSTNFIAIIPKDHKTYRSYRLRRDVSCFRMRTPSIMANEKMLAKGTYRLYKAKDALVIKRYEPLKEEELNG